MRTAPSRLSAREGVTWRVIREVDDWDALRPEWDALYASRHDCSTPLDFVWLRTWWRIFGHTYGTRGLRIITVWQGTRLVGALPMYEGRRGGSSVGVRELQFVSTGEAEYEETCPDYLDLLCARGEEESCIDAVWDCIEALDWDCLELVDLPEESPLLHSRAIPGRVTTIARGTCPVADLEGGFDAYLARLSANSRQQARRLLREAERAGATFEIVGADRADHAFDDLVRLHQARWTAAGRPGVFAAPRFTAFHREIVREWLPAGRALLARLSVGGEPVAVIYGFVTRSTFDFYQSGVRHDPPGSLRSAGTLAHLLLMQTLAPRGITAYDFLRGASTYKTRLATRERRLVALRVWRRTLRSTTQQSLRFAARITRRGVRPFLSGHGGR